MSPLKDSFIDGLVDLTTSIVEKKGEATHLDVFMMLGGGAHKNNGKLEVDGLTITSIPQRDFVVILMFDISFDLNLDPNATEKAIESQLRL